MGRVLTLVVLAGCTASVDPGETSSPVPPDPVPDPEPTQVPLQCADPGARDSLGPYEVHRATTEPSSEPWMWGNGMLVANLDADPALEVWVTGQTAIHAFELSDQGITPDAGPSGGKLDVGAGSGGAIADYDGDGDLDVYVTRWWGWPGSEIPEAGLNRLFRNDGAKGFVDVTDSAGGLYGCTPDHCLRSVASSFGDYDRDGDLDLFVGAHGLIAELGMALEDRPPGEPSFLYENNGDGTFTDASDKLPAGAHDGYTFSGGWFDMDHDGWLDLYLVNDVGSYQPNQIIWNREGVLQLEETESSGLDIALEGMGLGVGDLNGDLLPDVAVAGWGQIAFLQSFEDLGVWVDSSSSTGITLRSGMKVAWGTDLADLDNDGDLDLLNQFGLLDEGALGGWGNPADQPDALYLNVGTPTSPGFEEVGADWGLDDIGVNRGVVRADINRDGWLDLLKHDLRGELILYLSRCGTEGWLEVALDQPGTLNPDAVGAEILVTAGDQTWTRTIRSGGTSIGTALPPVAHFGLGDLDAVDQVQVIWPDGSRTELGGLETRQSVTFTRKETK